MTEKRPLRLNWIEGRSNLSGGVKSNRLIAEAMQRRGHAVTTSFLTPAWAWPPPWRVRRFLRRVRRGIGSKHFPHHLQQGAITLNQMPKRRLDPDLIPDADVTFASWWEVWSQIHAWPSSKGLKVHYVRGLETYHHGREDEVEQAYRLSGPRVVISSWLQRMLQGFGHDEIERIPNGVSWGQFDSEPRSKSKQPTIGMLMGASKIKDTATAFRAIERLRGRYPELRVVGFGALPLPNSMNVPDCVEFHQSPPQELIPKLYQLADCWVISSTTEGFGMPGIEAMASHCPIVSTRCGGPEDFVREGENGYLVEVGDDEAMAERVSRVLDLDEEAWKRMSAASYRIAQEFDWDRSAEKLEAALYRWLDHPREDWSR